MAYDKNAENSSTSDRFQDHRGRHRAYYGRHEGGGPGWDGMSWATSPGFHPLKALTVLGGFAVFPPLGVLALGYFLWNSRHSFGRHHGPEATEFAGGPGMGRGRCGGRGMRGRFTGNAAFDEHMMQTIEKLREERRAFFEFRAAERRKRDQDAYDAFRSAQSTGGTGEDPETPKA
jgi:hypothetical protein